MIQNITHLLRARRFVPLFATQFLGAFNDSLFKQAVVLFVTYQLYSNPAKEFQFSAIAQGLFILPFFLFSALSGQLADDHDKARLIRIIKFAEIGIMILGGAGIMLANIPLMLAAVFAMGVHSTFFGPIKYAILPQHLHKDEVLGGTGLVEAGTYIAILLGTILAGVLAARPGSAAVAVIGFALLGYLAGRQVPPAPPAAERLPITWHIVHASIELVSATMHIRRLFLAILAISFFWTIGAVLIIIFPPLVKNVLGANEQVASLFIAIFSIGIAIGSVLINRLLKSEVSARFAPASVIAMGVFVLMLHFVSLAWDKHNDSMVTPGQFPASPARRADDRRAARGGDHRGHVRGSALCIPDDHGAEGRDRAHGRGQQYRQFRGDGDRLPDGLRSEQPRRRPGRAALARRGDVPGFGVARVEAPPRLRLSEQDRHEHKADDEGQREQLEVVADGRRHDRRRRELANAPSPETRAGPEHRLGGRAAWQILNAIFTMFKLGKRGCGSARPAVGRTVNHSSGD